MTPGEHTPLSRSRARQAVQEHLPAAKYIGALRPIPDGWGFTAVDAGQKYLVDVVLDGDGECRVTMEAT